MGGNCIVHPPQVNYRGDIPSISPWGLQQRAAYPWKHFRYATGCTSGGCTAAPCPLQVVKYSKLSLFYYLYSENP